MLRVIHRRYQTASQGIVMIKMLPNTATIPRQRNCQPLPTNSRCSGPRSMFRQSHRIPVEATHAQPMIVHAQPMIVMEDTAHKRYYPTKGQ